jgi:hypothetical protein
MQKLMALKILMDAIPFSDKHLALLVKVWLVAPMLFMNDDKKAAINSKKD